MTASPHHNGTTSGHAPAPTERDTVRLWFREAEPEVAEALRCAHECAIADGQPLSLRRLAEKLLTAPSVHRRLGRRADGFIAVLRGDAPVLAGRPGVATFDLGAVCSRATERQRRQGLLRPDAVCLLTACLEPGGGPETDELRTLLVGVSRALATRRSGLDGLGTDATLAYQLDPDAPCPVVGNDEAIASVLAALNVRRFGVLLAEPGTGKSEVAKGVAWHLARGTSLVPPALRGCRMLSLRREDIVAGTGERGSLERQVKRLFALAEQSDYVLFLDELHSVSGTSDEAAALVANALKARLKVVGLRVFGASTPTEFYRSVMGDDALASRLVPIPLPEPDEAAVLAILEGAVGRHVPDAAGPDGVAIEPAARHAAYRISRDHQRQWRQPRAALGLLIDAVSAVWYRAQTAGGPRTVTADDVARAFSARTGLPVTRLLGDPLARAADLAAALRRRVHGQDVAIAAVVAQLRARDLGRTDPTRPRGSFVFLGPPGVGKRTLLCALAAELGRDRDALFRVDLGSPGPGAVAELRGAPPSYVGYLAQPTAYSHVTFHPGAVVALDNWDRADLGLVASVSEILDGRARDAAGREADFAQAVVVLCATTPEGVDPGLPEPVVRDLLLEQGGTWTPTLLDRIDRIAVFGPLDDDALGSILDDASGRLEAGPLEPAMRSDLVASAGGSAARLLHALTEYLDRPEKED